MTDLLTLLRARAAADPFQAVATVIFVAAIAHTFAAPSVASLAHRVRQRHTAPSVLAEALQFFGEVEVTFGLWAVVLIAAMTMWRGWEAATHYVNESVSYTEASFVVVIMAIAASRPIVTAAEAALHRIAALGRSTPAAWWVAILIVAPVFGSLITEPGAMTLAALLLGRHFYDRRPGDRLKYATLGLLFVNVSIGGTLTHFAAPPVLMVARPWGWDTAYMLAHFGWRALAAIVASTAIYFVMFRRELGQLAARPAVADVEVADEDAEAGAALLPVPAWVTAAHLIFLGWTVFNSHYPALFIGGFLFFLGFVRATAMYQSRMDLKRPLLVGFFLGGLVIHGGLQGWWISPLLASLSPSTLFLGSTILTSLNDNALITYLATLAPAFDEKLRIAVVQGAVTGGGLTVIANAPNPAGQAMLSPFFDGAILPLRLLAGALLPTLIAAAAFRLF